MQTRDYQFKGQTYHVACIEDYPNHPTWFTYVDESDVRDRYWDIAPGDFVMDVGAAFGSYAVTALSAGATHVWAWAPEGIPGSVSEKEMLCATLGLNGWSKRCTIYTNGVYDKNGWLNTSNKQFCELEPVEHDLHTIPVYTLDAWYAETNPARVDWMKLDVEGAEVNVLRGAESLIRDRRPRILVENHLFVRESIAAEVRQVLEQLGYQHESTIPYHTVSHSLYVPRR